MGVFMKSLLAALSLLLLFCLDGYAWPGQIQEISLATESTDGTVMTATVRLPNIDLQHIRPESASGTIRNCGNSFGSMYRVYEAEIISSNGEIDGLYRFASLQMHAPANTCRSITNNEVSYYFRGVDNAGTEGDFLVFHDDHGQPRDGFLIKRNDEVYLFSDFKIISRYP